jgi:hypothetical protein
MEALEGSIRIFIRSSRKRFDKHCKEGETDVMADVVKFASGDSQKAFLLITSVGEPWVSIAFDYDNPNHNECVVRGFRIKKHIKPAGNPPGATEYVHGQVRFWASQLEKYGINSWPQRRGG